MRDKKDKKSKVGKAVQKRVKKGKGINRSLSSFNNLLNERDLMMVGDIRYFGIERFNYRKRSK